MRVGMAVGRGALALAVSSFAWAAGQSDRVIDRWSPGEGNSAYNRVLADCETLTHSFGRNGTWGRWRMPMNVVRFSVRPSEPGETPRIFVECLTQGGCITQARGGVPTASHYIEFGGQTHSEAMVTAIHDLQSRCAAPAA